MEEQTQQEYLRAAKKTLDFEWDQFAKALDVEPRAFKTYRMPDSSADHRGLPTWVRKEIDKLLSEHQRKARKASGA